MIDVSWQDIAKKFSLTFGLVSIRYIVFAGSLFLIFYIWKKREFLKYKIQQKFPENKHIIREISYSFMSLTIFSVVATLVFIARKNGYTKVYTNLSDHSAAYFIFSVVAFIVIHDTYFYWAHRFMHWKKIYPYVHKIHHLSTNPTPWAAFAFHPIEALIEVAILPIMVFIMPLHHFAILSWALYQTGMNVMGHLGFEMFPTGFVTGQLSKLHNTSTHHNMHHKHVNCNYGLYYNYWDRLMGTNHTRYEEEFERVKTQAAQTGDKEPEVIPAPVTV